MQTTVGHQCDGISTAFGKKTNTMVISEAKAKIIHVMTWITPLIRMNIVFKICVFMMGIFFFVKLPQ